MITVRDICPQCSHLWDEHAVGRIPKVEWRSVNDLCGCCQRMATRAAELNA